MQYNSSSSSSSSSPPSLALNDARESFAQGEDAVFHVVLDGTATGGTGLAFVAAAPAASGTAGPGAFLDEARGRTALCLAEAGIVPEAAQPYSLDSVLKPLLAAAASALSKTGGGAARRLQEDLEEVREIMGRNIDAALDRGERLELLVAKTDALGGAAGTFARGAGALARSERWRELKGKAAAVAFVVAVAVVLAVVVLGPWMKRKEGGGGGGGGGPP